MANIRIDTDGLQNNISSMRAYVNELDSLNARTQSLLAQIASSWEGEASTAYINIMTERMQKAGQMKELLQEFLSYMAPAGKLFALEEKLQDAGSAVAGCGPAFAAMFLEAMADGGVACGLPRAAAVQYAAQMMLGTAKMVLETGQHPGVLKDSVCSPAGSTIQGVQTLEKCGMRAAVFDAVTVAYEKNVELKKASD